MIGYTWVIAVFMYGRLVAFIPHEYANDAQCISASTAYNKAYGVEGGGMNAVCQRIIVSQWRLD